MLIAIHCHLSFLSTPSEVSLLYVKFLGLFAYTRPSAFECYSFLRPEYIVVVLYHLVLTSTSNLQPMLLVLGCFNHHSRSIT